MHLPDYEHHHNFPIIGSLQHKPNFQAIANRLLRKDLSGLCSLGTQRNELKVIELHGVILGLLC